MITFVCKSLLAQLMCVFTQLSVLPIYRALVSFSFCMRALSSAACFWPSCWNCDNLPGDGGWHQGTGSCLLHAQHAGPLRRRWWRCAASIAFFFLH